VQSLCTAQGKVAIMLSCYSVLLIVALGALPNLPVGMFHDPLQELIPFVCSVRALVVTLSLTCLLYAFCGSCSSSVG
jgi:hypothetical protein